VIYSSGDPEVQPTAYPTDAFTPLQSPVERGKWSTLDVTSALVAIVHSDRPLCILYLLPNGLLFVGESACLSVLEGDMGVHNVFDGNKIVKGTGYAPSGRLKELLNRVPFG